ncbi:MAG: acyl-CoA synthetase [Pseudomonadota bacterium]
MYSDQPEAGTTGTPIRTQADIAALEQIPWQQRQPAASSYALLTMSRDCHPDRVALRFILSAEADAPEFSFTYAQLHQRVTQAANAFHRAGIAPGDTVALLLPNLPETHFALFGAQAAGIANPINPMLDVEQIAAIVNATGARAVVALAPHPDFAIWDKAVAVANRCPSVETLFAVGLGDYVGCLAAARLDDMFARARKPERDSVRILGFGLALAMEPDYRLGSGRQFDSNDICACFHTGGTTGVPKIARHTHQNEVYIATMLDLLEPRRQVVLCGLPLFHVNGAMVTGLAAFHAGWEVVLLTPSGYRGRHVLDNFWRIAERFGATSFSAVPTVFATLAGIDRAGANLSSLQHAFCGAAPLPATVAASFEAATGIRVCEGYGLTEGACVSALNPTDDTRRPGSVGLRLPYQELQAWRINAAGRAQAPCLPGETGVIGIKGPNVFPGYLREHDNHGIWLAPDWLNTGDLGYLDDDGFLHLAGRAKDLIIRGGHNIDPGMIESALLQHPAIAQVAAVGQPDEHSGELPVAYVVLRPGADIEAHTLHTDAAGLVPERAAAPVRIEVLPHLPLTAIGKLAKAELRLRAASHVLSERFAQAGVDASLEMHNDSQRGMVATVRCAPAARARVSAMVGRFALGLDMHDA